MSLRGHSILALLAAVLVGLSIGCAAKNSYMVTLKDGRQIETGGWPTLNEVTGYYRVEDPAGQLRAFREQDVASIVTVKPGER